MYEKVEFVRNKGEFAIRGDIVDIFSPNEKKPVRISFNFEDIESLNFFNPENQKSEEKIDNYSLFIASEILFNDSTIRNFRQVFRKLKLIIKKNFTNLFQIEYYYLVQINFIQFYLENLIRFLII